MKTTQMASTAEQINKIYGIPHNRILLCNKGTKYWYNMDESKTYYAEWNNPEKKNILTWVPFI